MGGTLTVRLTGVDLGQNKTKCFVLFNYYHTADHLDFFPHSLFDPVRPFPTQ